MSAPIVSEDPLHLIATYDPAEQDETPLQKQLSRTISREDEGTSSSKSPNVYVDELAGSDSHGTGTKQAPFQTIYGAFKNRGSDAHIFVKRRCVESKTKYWVPTDSGVDLDLMRLPTRDRAAEAEAHKAKIAEAEKARDKVKAEKPADAQKNSAPASSAAPAPSSSAQKSNPAPAGGEEKSGFMGKLKKMFK